MHTHEVNDSEPIHHKSARLDKPNTARRRTLDGALKKALRRQRRTSCAVVAVLSTVAASALAQARAPSALAQARAPSADATAVRPRYPEMPLNVPLDLGITLGAGAAWVTSELLASTLAPSSCRWCDHDSNGNDGLNGFDGSVRGALRWRDTATADTLSNVFSFGLAPLAGFGVGALVAWHDERLDELPADTLVVAESAVIAISGNQLAKFAFARQRPDVHAREIAGQVSAPSPGDNLSFFSGHATLAFALATSAGTVASMRHHQLAPLMWVAGLALATSGGYLRIAADRHYATDVLTGALFGSAVGFSVPYFAHRPRPLNARLAVLPVAAGSVVTLSGTW